MATQSITPTAFGFIPGQAGVDLTPADLTTYSNTNTGVIFPNIGGRSLLVIYNGYTASITIQPVVQRQVEGVAPTVSSYSLPTLKMQGFGPFPFGDFNDANGNVTVNITAAGSGVTVGVFEMTTAPQY